MRREIIKRDSLEDLYLSYFGPLKDYLYYLTGDLSLTEDLVQEVFYRAGRNLLFNKKITSVSAWLYTIARNLYLDYLRKNKTPTLSFEQLSEHSKPAAPDHDGLPERVYEEKENRELIIGTLMSLKESQRTALLLREHQGLSYEEIAAVMRLTPAAVKSLLSRARIAFRQEYLKEKDLVRRTQIYESDKM